ncbi:alginate lyase family protein [Litorimonas sp. RW-G-Af-16]|uniref:alginate lyase family protein n=1 Tax=Litorimonas sp. RW-G-Af-16 TaxID=3241168 RepID=UPI00390C5798
MSFFHSASKFVLTAAIGTLSIAMTADAQTSSTAAPQFTDKCAQPTGKAPRLYVLDHDNLAFAKDQVQVNSREVMPAYDALIKNADAALTRGPYSVTHKTKTPPSGDKHDYYSVGPYWWPDPKSDDGLPYIRRDGQTNPERYDDSFDSSRFSKFGKDVEALTLASYFSGNAKYADKAAAQIRTWFIDPATKMNPNLNYGQAIPGRTEGRGIGIIDTYRLVALVDMIGLLEHQGALSPADVAAIQDWFADYTLWLLTSKNGKEERATVNNHGIYYDMQVAAYSAFVGDAKAVQILSEGIRDNRIPAQINKKGQMPHELKRTRPFHYTAYTIQAFMDAADIAECVGMDLWNHETKRGQSLKRAVDFQANYAGRLSAWPHKEIKKISTGGFYRNLLRAEQAYGSGKYAKAAAQHADRNAKDYSNLLFPNRP